MTLSVKDDPEWTQGDQGMDLGDLDTEALKQWLNWIRQR